MDEEKKQGGLTPEWKKAVREMVEQHYGVKLGERTEEEEAHLKEILHLLHEYRQKEKQSGEKSSKDMPID